MKYGNLTHNNNRFKRSESLSHRILSRLPFNIEYPKKLSKETGVPTKVIQKVIDGFISDNIIMLEDNEYKVI